MDPSSTKVQLHSNKTLGPYGSFSGKNNRNRLDDLSAKFNQDSKLKARLWNVCSVLIWFVLEALHCVLIDFDIIWSIAKLLPNCFFVTFFLSVILQIYLGLGYKGKNLQKCFFHCFSARVRSIGQHFSKISKSQESLNYPKLTAHQG